MTHVLVTGGAGFIGANYVRFVVNTTDWRVTVLDTLNYASSPEALADLPEHRCRLVVGDICDAETVDSLTASADAVVHLAAESHNDRAILDPASFVTTNVMGTATVLEAVRRHGVRLHHVSTDEVFGDLPLDSSRRFDESSAYQPSNPYSASKASADHLVRAWVRTYGIEATISNCSNNFGPWQHVEKFIPRQITRVLCGEAPHVYGDGLHVRDWIHVDDHNRAMHAILTRGAPGRTYAIGAECEASNADVAATVLRLAGRPSSDIAYVGDRPGHDRRYAIDASRVRDELGWRPHHGDLESGLADTMAWYRKHRDWWQSAREDSEARYRETGQ